MNVFRFATVAAPSAFLLSLLTAAAASAAAAPQSSGTSQGLTPVGPEGLQALTLGQDALSSVPITADTIADSLSDPDIERRERSLDELVELARTQPDVRRALEELAAQGADPELAWSARLALKLVEATFDRRGATAAPRTPRSWSGLAEPEDPFHALDALFQGWPSHQRGLGFDPFGIRSGPGAGLPQGWSSQQSRGQSIELRQDSEGTLLRLEETDENGDRQTREYRGESLEDILSENPQLEEELEDGGVALRFGSAGDPWEALERGFSGAGLRPWSGFPGGQGLLEQLLAPQSRAAGPRTDVLGVRVAQLTDAHARELGLEAGRGLFVDSVVPGTIAAELSVPAGAVLLELDGRSLAGVEDVSSAMRARAPDAPLQLTWLDSSGTRVQRTWQPAPVK